MLFLFNIWTKRFSPFRVIRLEKVKIRVPFVSNYLYNTKKTNFEVNKLNVSISNHFYGVFLAINLGFTITVIVIWEYRRTLPQVKQRTGIIIFAVALARFSFFFLWFLRVLISEVYWGRVRLCYLFWAGWVLTYPAH